MSLDNVISRLNKVRRTGNGRYIACCPAHVDHTPSLAIRELDDGRVLIKCFSGCSAEAVLDAIGLTFSDLFAEPLQQYAKPERVPFSARDVLACVVNEMRIILLAGIFIGKGKKLHKPDMDRLLIAVSRINEALELINA